MTLQACHGCLTQKAADLALAAGVAADKAARLAAEERVRKKCERVLGMRIPTDLSEDTQALLKEFALAVDAVVQPRTAMAAMAAFKRLHGTALPHDLNRRVHALAYEQVLRCRYILKWKFDPDEPWFSTPEAATT